MNTPRFTPFIEYVRRLGGEGDDAPDGELLQSFARGGDAAAFERLLRRHGPMVMGVCRRVLRDGHAAEDAFQATFLLLVRKARGLRRPDRIGPWLHGVAYRAALQARDRVRRRRETPMIDEPSSPSTAEQGDWKPVLDAAIARLPTRERAAVVLCYLEGLTYADAARRLRCPLGTLAARLARARERLRVRLLRQGLAPAAGVVTASLAADAPALPPALIAVAVRGAVAMLSGAATGVVSESVLSLMAGVRQTMLLHTWKMALGVLLALGVAGTGAGILVARTTGATGEPDPPAPPAARAANDPPAALAKPSDGERLVPISLLGQKPPEFYLVNAGDVLGIYVEGIFGKQGDALPVILPPAGGNQGLPPAIGYPVVVAENGALSLPLIDPLNVTGRSVFEVQELVSRAYTSSKILVVGRERVLVSVARPRTYRVTIVRLDRSHQSTPHSAGVSSLSLDLPAYENDVLTALARTGGLPPLNPTAAITIQRRRTPTAGDATAIQEIRIPLLTRPGEPIPSDKDVILQNGDVVIVDGRASETPPAGATPARPANAPPVLSLAVAAPDGRILVQLPGAENAAANWQMLNISQLTAMDSDGRPIGEKALLERVQKMTAVLVATDGRTPSAVCLQALKPGTLVLVIKSTSTTAR